MIQVIFLCGSLIGVVQSGDAIKCALEPQVQHVYYGRDEVAPCNARFETIDRELWVAWVNKSGCIKD